jgi:hypothetical protein
LTLLVNALARIFVMRAARGGTGAGGPQSAPGESPGDLGAAVAMGA